MSQIMPQDQHQNRSIQQIHKEEHYEGPIPPPVMLEQYNRIVPGAAERIIKMAEEQAEHRQYLEKQVVRSDTRNSLLGIISALAISLAVLSVAYVALRSDQTAAGVIISALGLSSLVGTFVYGTRSRRIERQDRSGK